MLPDLRTLLDIQELDAEALELNSQLAKYPTIWEEVKKKLTAKKEGVKNAEENKEKHIRERRRIEQKLRLFSDDVRKYQEQQKVLKTPKEYEAINKQIEQLRTKIAQLEEQGLLLISRDESVDTDITGAKEELKKIEETATKEKERIRVQFNEKKSRLAHIETERKRLVSKVSPEALALYDRVSKRHPGSVLVAVRSSSCGGCHFSLLPNVLVQVHRQEKMINCPNCSRIFSGDENFAEHSQVG